MCDFCEQLGLKCKSFWQNLFNFFAKIQFKVGVPIAKKKMWISVSGL